MLTWSIHLFVERKKYVNEFNSFCFGLLKKFEEPILQLKKKLKTN